MSEQKVALVGAIPAGAKETIASDLPTDIDLVRVPDVTDRDHTRRVLRDAQVVVGDWPEYPIEESSVELVQQTGAGTENYDRDKLPDGVTLCNVYGHGPGMAEHVLMVLIALRRDLLGMDSDLRDGKWVNKTSGGDVSEIRGSTLGIVGFGTIGQSLLGPAKAFNMDVIGIRGTPPARTPDGVRFMGGPGDLDEVLAESDAVVLSVPLNESTKSLLSTREFERMRDDALLINVARGPVVDDEALYDALRNDAIGGAAIDTWYNYPEGNERCAPADYPFHELDNVIMTPHMSGWTVETAKYRWRFVSENIMRYYNGEDVDNVVAQYG